MNLSTTCPNLTSLDVGGCYNISIEGLIKFISSHPNRKNFTHLELSGSGGVGVTDKLMRLISSQCPNLIGLGIGYGKELSDNVLLSLLKSESKLESLQIHWNQKLSDDFIIGLMTCCPKLEELNLTGCQNFSEIVRSPKVFTRFSVRPAHHL